MLDKLLIAAALFAAVTCASTFSAFANTFAEHDIELHHFQHQQVLGTSLDIRIAAPLPQAKLAEQAVLASIQKQENIFSSYNTESELSRLNRGDLLQSPSAALLEIIKLCEHWREQLPKAFSCRMGDVIDAWQQAFEQQVRPDRRQIRALARRAGESNFNISDYKEPGYTTNFSWNFGAIAKGYIIDNALNVARQEAPQATAISIDIGGDAAYWLAEGSVQPWAVKVADPDRIDDSQHQHLGTLRLSNGAVAYSGHSSRARIIARRSYSHILVPRDGWPKIFSSAAIVKAPTATEADALATALAALPIPVALDWVDKKQNAEIAVLLIGEDGRHHASGNWQRQFHPLDQVPLPLQATIRFALPTIRDGEYRRPYVAMWLENGERKVVKNLLLLGDNERWMTENRYWWRKQGRNEIELLEGFARPTRRPGEYELHWYGLDDHGKVMPRGNYTLQIEAAREHGDHERLSISFELGDNTINTIKKGQRELNFLQLIIKEA